MVRRAGLQGVGRGPAPSSSPGFTLLRLERGLRRRGTEDPPGAASSALPLPALPPPRWAAPREEKYGAVASRRSSPWWWSPSPAHLAFLFLRAPSCLWAWGLRGPSAETGLAEDREKRSASCRFCKIAVTTLCPGCGWGRGRIGL